MNAPIYLVNDGRPSLLPGALFRYCRLSYRLPVFDSIMIAPNTFGVVMGTPLINRVVLRLVRQDPTLVLIF